ncbi:MAG: hypothetical protein EXR36_07525 [Betaproteobacteria bacterium]|nr:hypothetical protein [Betaproteobacteria bacterium]
MAANLGEIFDMLALRTSVVVLLCATAGMAGANNPPSVENLSQHLPLAFEANKGQFPAQAKFLARTPGKQLFLVPQGMVMVLGESSAGRSVVRVDFRGAAKASRYEGVDPLEAKTHYFRGSQSYTDVPNFARAREQGIYPGIDVIYYANQGRVEHDFIVAPGSDSRKIRLQLSGHQDAKVNAAGDLVLATGAGELVMHQPVAYQEQDSQRTYVPARYVVRANEVRFELAAYDTRRTLVIDPVVSFAANVGGGSAIFPYAIAVDASGNTYITGQTHSTDYPVIGAYQSRKAGTADAFVTKLNANGTGLVYSTYLGGRSGLTEGRGIAVDSTGNAYIAGRTSSANYPVTTGVYQYTKDGLDAGFFTKLSPQGNTLAYSTFIRGGTAAAIAVNSEVAPVNWTDFG